MTTASRLQDQILDDTFVSAPELSGLALDPYSGQGFAVTTPLKSTSTLYKFLLDSLRVVGIQCSLLVFLMPGYHRAAHLFLLLYCCGYGLPVPPPPPSLACARASTWSRPWVSHPSPAIFLLEVSAFSVTERFTVFPPLAPCRHHVARLSNKSKAQ